MNENKLEQTAQGIIANLELENKDGGLTFIDYNQAYRDIIAAAKEHADQAVNEAYPV